MRTAEEFLEDEFSKVSPKIRADAKIRINSDLAKKLITRAINQARKQTIEECAERAQAFISVNDEPKVGKQSILSLIDELK